MSLISTRLSLTHLVTVQRDDNAGSTSGGWTQAPDWQDYLTDVPCRAWTQAGREQVDATTTIVVEDLRLIMLLDTDVTEHDRLGDIRYRGDTIIPGPFDIHAVLFQRDFLELVLVRIS